MSNPVLHIKDSYYFEIPKFLLPSRRTDKSEFPDVWVKNDPQFQESEAEEVYHGLSKLSAGKVDLPDEHDEIHRWQHWQHEGSNHENFAKPFDVYLETLRDKLNQEFTAANPAIKPEEKPAAWEKFLAEKGAAHAHGVWFARLVPVEDEAANDAWTQIKKDSGSNAAVEKWKTTSPVKWDQHTLDAYNEHLSGKILIPQPFGGELRNFYERESGFAVSRFMVMEVCIGLILFVVFTWVAGRVQVGSAPKGRLWNFFEVFLLFIRDQIARPAIGGNHDEHEEAHADSHPTGVAEGHAIGGAGIGGAPVEMETSHHGHHPKADHSHGQHHHKPFADADRFVPLLWTIFFFVLGCNLFGMIPWLGAPTGAWGATFGLACVTFFTVWVVGIWKFGVLGFFLNQIPGMDLPWYMAIILKPMIFAIEMLGLFIKHLVLSIRLLANMVAGHLVILAVMGLAFGAEAALNFKSPDVPAWQWPVVATIAVLGSTLFNVLELFVAFLQAYVFTFLSALFIGASVHKH